MSKENMFSLILYMVTAIVQGVAWVSPDIPQNTRILWVILSLLLPLLAVVVQGASSQGIRAWLSSTAAFLRMNYPLAFLAGFSLLVLVFIPYVNGRAITDKAFLSDTAMSVAVVLFTISLFTLARGVGAQPSLRVVKGSGDKVYLVKDGIRQNIPDPQTISFVLLDTYRDIECISDKELQLYREGEPLQKLSQCRLVKGNGPAVYIVWGGKRKHIPDPPTRDYFFKDRSAEELSDSALEEIPRTGALPSVSSLRPTITVHGNVENISLGN